MKVKRGRGGGEPVESDEADATAPLTDRPAESSTPRTRSMIVMMLADPPSAIGTRSASLNARESQCALLPPDN